MMIKMIIHPHLIHLMKVFLYKRQLKYIRRQIERTLGGPSILTTSSELGASSTHMRTVKIEGPFWGSYSLSVSNRAMAKVLLDHGYDVGTANIDGDGVLQPLDHQTLKDYPFLAGTILRSREIVDPDLTLCQQYPPVTAQMRGKVRAYHAYGWEESAFPAAYVTNFNRDLDFISVASTYVAKTLRDNGVTIPIISPGLGLSPMPPGVPLPSLRKRLKKTVFLHISTALLRKGIDVLLDAYGMAFTEDDDVSLLLKTVPTVHNEVDEQLRAHRQHNPRYPHVVYINEDWSTEKISGLYDMADWAVFPTRGEGFGLPLADAMSRKVPVITTAYGGQVDFCKPGTALLCNYSFAYSRSHVATGESLWVEPDPIHLSQILRQAVFMGASDKKLLIDEAFREIKKATWEGVAGEILSAADKMEGYRSLLSKAMEDLSVGWVSTWNARCGIATYSQNLSRAFVDKGLIVFAKKEKELCGEDEEFVRRVWTPDKEGLQSLMRSLQGNRFDALVIQHNTGLFGLDWLFNLLLFSRDHRIDTYIFLHNVREIVGSTQESREDLALILKVATRIFVHSLPDMNLLKPFGEIGNLTLFPHGVYDRQEGKETLPDEQAEAPWRHKKVIASFGFILPHKGLSELVEAFRILRGSEPNLHLLLVNAIHSSSESYTEFKKLRAQIDRLALNDHVTLVSEFLTEEAAYSYLRHAEVIVYPYQRSGESSSGAVKFGISCGRPVAVAPLSLFDDVPETVAFRLPDVTPNGIAKGIRELLRHPDWRESFIINARSYRESRQWSHLSKRLLAIIEGCRNQRRFEEIQSGP